ncbi:MAG: hypothetical protein AUI47_09365 [Acidobacteria bacterium 13_1_40CM_2_68_5]|nr:MAG: hypothetical protein AUI47_09365 [Acidobacteria bacterium 13_1_40CM_2_68_5]
MMAVGAALLVYTGAVTMRGWVWQERHAELFEGALRPAARLDGPAGPAPIAASGPGRGGALARLRVPRLGIDVVVAEGTDPHTLSLGAGHLEGSALPGRPDNCIIAGHREGPFRRLRGARPGDLVEIAETNGLERYRIDSVEIVAKGDTWALASSNTPLLTLVTCYPFHYVGRSPQRFIVRAALIDRRS